MTRYCVSCQNLITLDETAVAFKTGYYKITIPLALCGRCMAERNGLNDQDTPHAVDLKEDQLPDEDFPFRANIPKLVGG
jgi:hypothetical protein